MTSPDALRVDPPPGRPPVASSGVSRGTIVVLGALSAFGPLSLDMYLPGLPAMADDLDASGSLAQLTLTAALVGLAAGQLLAGPVSDALGRRRPLLVGLVVYAISSALCAVAPTVEVLVVLRLVEGLAGGAGIVIAQATVRDRSDGPRLARLFARLALVNGLAPILAPVVGGQLLHVTDWRGVFGVLAAIGALLWATALVALPESLPVSLRRTGGLAASVRTFGQLLGDRRYVGHALSCGLAFGAMFAYIAGSPFVLEDIYGVSPQLFSAIFATNAFGILALSQVSARLVDRAGPAALLAVGVAQSALGGVALLVCVLAGAGLGGVLPSLFAVVASIGLIMPNAMALALADHRERAGSAAALVGLGQYLFGGLVAPLVGIAGTHTAVPMAVLVALLGTAAAVVLRALAPA